ncbi:MAG: hypothetical protein ABJC09_04540 [Terriglobia bacterium]
MSYRTRTAMAGRLSIALTLCAASLFAQDEKPLVFGDFENTGSVTTGYRFTDVKGYRPKYQELFDLNSGFRLLDFSLFGHAKKGANAFADDYSLVISGIGGEPFSTAQLNVRKRGLYDLRINFRESHYYWNRNDSATLPTGLNGLTSNHDWATVRSLGSLNLLIHASSRLRFSLEYGRNTRDGAQDTTRALDYFGSSPTWGSFARANPYYLTGVVDETSNRIAAGIDYTPFQDWTFHYKLGLQRFEDSFTGVNPFSGERSINTDDATTALELLTNASWSDHHKFSTPVSEFAYNGKFARRFSARGGYIFYRYSGPASLDMSAAGLARGSSTAVISPYAFSDSSRATVREPNHVIDQGFTYDLNDKFGMQADYRYSRFDVFANATFSSTANGVTVAGTENNQWRLGTHTLDYNLIATPTSALLIRAGVRYLKSDIEFLENGLVDPVRTKRIKSVWPIISVSYKPGPAFSIRGDIDEINNGTSYTRETPHTDVGGRIITRIRPIEKFWIENATVVRNRRLLTADYVSRVRANSTTLTFELNDKASAFAGFAYDSFYSQSFVNFVRGTAPITDITLTDQNVERTWQAGFNLTPVKRLTLSFAGNYVRVNGLGVVFGETPLYGPMTFPYASGSLGWDFPKTGKLTVQLQRTYYTEQIVSGNNFGAHVLLVAFTRNF